MDELEDVLVNQQESLFPAVLVGPEEEDEDEDDDHRGTNEVVVEIVTGNTRTR